MNNVDEVKEMLNKNLLDILFIAETKIDRQHRFLDASFAARISYSSQGT